MLSTGLLDWFFSDQSLMAAPAQNWLLGTRLIASIIFVETGLVVMPFLPGDSLSLAAWAFLGSDGHLTANLWRSLQRLGQAYAHYADP